MIGAEKSRRSHAIARVSGRASFTSGNVIIIISVLTCMKKMEGGQGVRWVKMVRLYDYIIDLSLIIYTLTLPL